MNIAILLRVNFFMKRKELRIVAKGMKTIYEYCFARKLYAVWRSR